MKLSEFPSVNYISLYECTERRQYMHDHLNALGINKINFYVTEKYNNIQNYVEVVGERKNEVRLQLGTIISHLNLLRNWYITCNEPYAIFCEDDVSFESINYWNFTWEEFVQNLPENWRCVQLMRMTTYKNTIQEDFKITLRYGRWWGSHSLMKREYVKALLDKYFIGYNKYNIEVENHMPIIENVLFKGLGEVYNFPMLVGNTTFETTLDGEPSIQQILAQHSATDHKLILEAWKNIGDAFDIKKVLNSPY